MSYSKRILPHHRPSSPIALLLLPCSATKTSAKSVTLPLRVFDGFYNKNRLKPSKMLRRLAMKE